MAGNGDKPKRCRQLVQELMLCSTDQRQQSVESILNLVGEPGIQNNWKEWRDHCQHCLEAVTELLLSQDLQPHPVLNPFLSKLEHLPLQEEEEAGLFTPGSFSALGSPESEAEPSLLRHLELCHLLASLGDTELAAQQLESLEQSPIHDPRLNILRSLAWARILLARKEHRQFCALWLNMICDIRAKAGAHSALCLVLHWIEILHWGRKTVVKRDLLLNILQALPPQEELLQSLAMYRLFTLEDGLVDPNQKMYYALRLIERSPSALNAQQTQHIHFFAGNYSSAMLGNFQESIRYYQQSNYWLHRNWMYLHNLSQFLRQQLDPAGYCRAMRILGRRVMELGNQVSLQGNAFVETLNSEYEKITQLYRKVEELSLTDNLTGLRNRRYMSNNLHQMFRLAARYGIPVSLAIVDVDFFKQVNDEHGHLAGDGVLRELAELIPGSFRASDIVIRYAGDEFLIVIFDSDPSEAIRLMEKLRARIAAHVFGRPQREIRLTVSIGISHAAHDTKEGEQMEAGIARADAALYKAKRSNRDKVVFSE